MTIGEPFQNAAHNVLRSTKKDGHLVAGHEKAFKPAKQPSKDLKPYSAYDHKADIEHKKKNYRDEEGNVTIAPRNFLTNPPKKGQVGDKTTFMPPPEHLPDNYNAAKEIAHKERLQHEAKLQEKPFSQKVKQTGAFNPDKAVYGADVPLPPAKVPPKKPTSDLHEKPFYPSKPPKRGYNKCLDKFPEYKENPLKFVTRKPVVEDA